MNFQMPELNTRAKHQQDRLIMAKKLLDLGLRDTDIAVKLQRDYLISRSTSYRDLDTAKQEFDIENHSDFVEDKKPLSLDDRDSVMEMTRQLMIDAFEQGDIQDFERMTKAYERLTRMGGSVWASHK